MQDIDAIEAINFEQLATVTDRLLLRGRVTRRRLSTNKILIRPEALARGSGPIATVRQPEPTEQVAVPKMVRFPFGLAAVTSLAAIAASLATLL